MLSNQWVGSSLFRQCREWLYLVIALGQVIVYFVVAPFAADKCMIGHEKLVRLIDLGSRECQKIIGVTFPEQGGTAYGAETTFSIFCGAIPRDLVLAIYRRLRNPAVDERITMAGLPTTLRTVAFDNIWRDAVGAIAYGATKASPLYVVNGFFHPTLPDCPQCLSRWSEHERSFSVYPSIARPRGFSSQAATETAPSAQEGASAPVRLLPDAP